MTNQILSSNVQYLVIHWALDIGNWDLKDNFISLSFKLIILI